MKTPSRKNVCTPRRLTGTRQRSGCRAAAVALLVALSLGTVGVASAGQRPAASDLQFEPGVGSLTTAWDASSTSGLAGFRIRWRPLTTPSSPWGKSVELPAKTRSYTITGLDAAVYEVRVRAIVVASRRNGARHRKPARSLGGATSGAATALAPGGELPQGPPHEEVLAGKEPTREKARELPKANEQPKEKAQPKAKEPAKEETPPEESGEEDEQEKLEEEPPKKEPPHEEPPVEEPPVEEPPAEEPPAEEGTGGSHCALYGSPGGNDASKGTLSAPLKTVPALLARLKAGQTGCLAPGSYEGFTTRAGESRGAQGAPVTITSTDPQTPATISGRVVTMPGANYLTFTHLNFTDSSTRGPSMTIGSAHTTWTDDDVTAPHTICFETTGPGQWGPAEDTLIERDRVHNCGQPFRCATDAKPCNVPPNNGYFIHGLYDLGIRTTARNSYFYEDSSKGILLRGGSGAVIEHNIIDANGSGVIFGDLTPQGDVVRWNIITNSSGVCGECDLYFGIWTYGSVGAGNSAVKNDVFANGSGNIGPHDGLTLAENVEVDPRFVNAAKHDYTLELDSPVLGYGPQ